MDKLVSLALLIDGALFSLLGVSATSTTGACAWMVVGGMAASIAGLTTLVRETRAV